MARSEAHDPSSSRVVVCVDFGSTFTKASLVDLADGRIVAAAEHPTTIDTDVLEGYDACLAALVEQDGRAADAPTLACSSAGGGLRIAVVGNEELVTRRGRPPCGAVEWRQGGGRPGRRPARRPRPDRGQ